MEDTASGVALRLSGAVTDSVVQGTTILRPQGTGLSIAGLSRRIVIGGTLVDGAGGDGLSAVRATCLRVQGLAITRGRSVGLRLKASGRIAVGQALITANAAAGIEIEAQPAGAPLLLDDLALSGNATGLRGWGSMAVDLRHLRVEGQAPRLFAGDLAPFTAAFLAATEQQGQPGLAIRLAAPAAATPLLVAAGAPAPARPAATPLLPPTADPWSGPCLSE